MSNEIDEQNGCEIQFLLPTLCHEHKVESIVKPKSDLPRSKNGQNQKDYYHHLKKEEGVILSLGRKHPIAWQRLVYELNVETRVTRVKLTDPIENEITIDVLRTQ